MPNPPTQIKKIRLGICMAGAVSAGAYTAGVMDYLLEALDRWEQCKQAEDKRKKQEPGYQTQVPKHEVEIVILGGASAGGMTAAIAARALAEEIEHVTPEKREKYRAGKNLNNLLYESWVKLTDADMVNRLLGPGDLNQYRNVLSLFNSDFKETLVRHVLLRNPVDKPAQRPYVDKQLELLLTLSNFDGVQVKYPFRSADGSRTNFIAQLHQDFAHFMIGSPALPGRIPLDFKQNTNIDTFADAAMATGAFPIGFEARRLKRPTAILAKNEFLKNRWGQLPDALQSGNPNRPEELATLNTDGGALNNEPFELIQEVLDTRFPAGSGDEKTPSDDTHNILLMIDPFPSNEPETGKPQQELKRNLFQVIPRLIGTLLHQGRAKPRDMHQACSQEDLKRFIIAPSRDGVPQGSLAIACGALGGFSGFLDVAFREHDFFLGRKNCQSFLQHYFSVPAHEFIHPDLMPAKYGWEPEAMKKIGRVPIIPDVTPGGAPMALEQAPDFPKYDKKNLERYRKKVLSRLKKIAWISLKPSFKQKAAFVVLAFLTLPFGPIFLLAGYVGLRAYVWNALKKLIISDLKKWQLLSDPRSND